MKNLNILLSIFIFIINAQTVFSQDIVLKSTIQKSIMPLVECVTNNQDGTFTAYFGYENPNSLVTKIPACSNSTSDGKINTINDLTDYCEQVSTFKIGRVKGAFNITFNKNESVTWKLKSSYNNLQTATASSSSSQCAKIEPYGLCIEKRNSNLYRAYFGYHNKNDFEIEIPVGAANTISPLPTNSGQSENFINGLINNAFDIDFTDTVTWCVNGNCATMDKNSAPCAQTSCTVTSLKNVKTILAKDDFMNMLKKQSSQLLQEGNPAFEIRGLEESVSQRLEYAESVDKSIKKRVAKLSDEIYTCSDDNSCPLYDNYSIGTKIKLSFLELQRLTKRTIRQRNIEIEQKQKFLRKVAKLFSRKQKAINAIPRFTNDCK